MENPFLLQKVKRLTVTALFPYNLEESGNAGISSFQEKMREGGKLPDGWEERDSGELKTFRLGRWFFREVQNLLFNDSDHTTRKMRWLRYPHYQRKLDEKQGRPLYIVVLNPFIEGKQADEYKVRVLGPVKDLELFALAAEIGTMTLGVRWRQDNLALQAAMDTIHFSSLTDGSQSLIAFISGNNEKLFAELKPPRDNTAAQASEKDTLLTFTATKEELADCLLLPPVDYVKVFPSIVDQIWKEMESPFSLPGKYLATKGRVPLVVNLDLEEEKLFLESEGAREQWRQLEWLCSRFFRHPKASGPGKTWVYPLPEGTTTDSPIATIRPTGTRGIHLSSEGLMSIGFLGTDFDNEWHLRMANEYFFAYIIALEQSIILQGISWRSYSRGNDAQARKDDPDCLFKFFTEFDTSYNFSRISNHGTIQSVYEAARKTLGVAETIQEVRSELQDWIEYEQREEQQNLNALAVIAILVSAATFIISLNLKTFTNDSAIAVDSRKVFFLVVPTLIVVITALVNGVMRRHLNRALKYLFGKKS
jgi:hypothetical protein